jgi:hypothetical protein
VAKKITTAIIKNQLNLHSCLKFQQSERELFMLENLPVRERGRRYVAGWFGPPGVGYPFDGAKIILEYQHTRSDSPSFQIMFTREKHAKRDELSAYLKSDPVQTVFRKYGITNAHAIRLQLSRDEHGFEIMLTSAPLCDGMKFESDEKCVNALNEIGALFWGGYSAAVLTISYTQEVQHWYHGKQIWSEGGWYLLREMEVRAEAMAVR